jgi:hypothetical protein
VVGRGLLHLAPTWLSRSHGDELPPHGRGGSATHFFWCLHFCYTACMEFGIPTCSAARGLFLLPFGEIGSGVRSTYQPLLLKGLPCSNDTQLCVESRRNPDYMGRMAMKRQFILSPAFIEGLRNGSLGGYTLVEPRTFDGWRQYDASVAASWTRVGSALRQSFLLEANSLERSKRDPKGKVAA